MCRQNREWKNMKKKIIGIFIVTLLIITGAFPILYSKEIYDTSMNYESFKYIPGTYLLTTQWGQTGKYNGNSGNSIDLYNLKLPWNMSAGMQRLFCQDLCTAGIFL